MNGKTWGGNEDPHVDSKKTSPGSSGQGPNNLQNKNMSGLGLRGILEDGVAERNLIGRIQKKIETQ